jgi:hypothetical protein
MAATKLTGTVPDANAPSGSVIQVVEGSTTTTVNTTSISFTDTGLSATITPSSTSSKILIVVSHTNSRKLPQGNEGGINMWLQKNGSNLAQIIQAGLWTATSVYITGGINSTYLDSPATTSAITYKTQFASHAAGVTAVVQENNMRSSIILMEIAG